MIFILYSNEQLGIYLYAIILGNSQGGLAAWQPRSPYPSTSITRAPVPLNLIAWKQQFPEYRPVRYDSDEIISLPTWAGMLSIVFCINL